MHSPQELQFNFLHDSVAVKQRLDSFRLGKGLPPTTTQDLSKHNPQRRRSHPRNTSISKSFSSSSPLAFSVSSSSPPCINDISPLPSPLPNVQSKRPNSHHRRRSSVSTRRESAELMGVSIPDLPVSISDENINLGEKDSIRRRALWALEGKPDLSFSKVEIPDFPTPETEKKMLDFPTKPSFPPGSASGYNGGLNSMMSKHDSFKLLGSSSSSKDQLHTLVEEEEEEEEESQDQEDESKSVEHSTEITETSPAPTVALAKSTPTRHRPANLNLRPLSLTPDSLVTTNNGLPTPALTPASLSFRLKALSLTPAPGMQPFHTSNVSDSAAEQGVPNSIKRQSLVLTPSSTPFSHIISRRPNLNILCESPSPSSCEDNIPKRRSSISYRTSLVGLPTPDMTPISEHRQSISCSSSEDESFHSRPLSASEQHFLFKSHNALLARITDLERALSSRPRSRSSSVASDASLSEPSDEMLQLIADLKAERDELKRDVDGWRTRVSDLDKQVGIFAQRVESERRDAWVARSRIGLLEAEKASVEKSLNEKTAIANQALENCDALKKKCVGLELLMQKFEEDIKAGENAELECVRLRGELAEERGKREELERVLEKANLMPTPTPRSSSFFPTSSTKRGLGFASVDSPSSGTDVESLDGGSAAYGFRLKAVEEEDEGRNNSCNSDEDNGLAGYEDEYELDDSFSSAESSSLGSTSEFRRLGAQPQFDPSVSPSLSASTTITCPNSKSPSPVPTIEDGYERPSHAHHSSLSRTWTFAKATRVPRTRNLEGDVDHFFECLEDDDTSPPLSSVDPSYENSKCLFSMGFNADGESDDELPPFVIPADVGNVVEAPPARLDVVPEEEEDDTMVPVGADDEYPDEETVFAEETSGIRITFTPPEPESPMVEEYNASIPAPRTRKPAPIFEPFYEEEEDSFADNSFNFGRTVSPQTEPIPKRTSPSPSMIPRKSGVATPPKPSPTRTSSSFVTPPSKRGGAMPSFIPQPVSSPSKNSSPTKPRASPSATFIPQPHRKPTMASPKGPHSTSNDTLPMNTTPTSSRFRRHAKTTPSGSSAEMNDISLCNNPLFSTTTSQEYSVDHDDTDGASTSVPSSLSSIMASPFAVRLSTFTTYLPWGARSPVNGISRSLSDPCEASYSPERPMTTPKQAPVGKLTTPIAERKFVSKEKQLEKLRTRLGQERLMNNKRAIDSCGTFVEQTVSL